jgi:hypothetical protein
MRPSVCCSERVRLYLLFRVGLVLDLFAAFLELARGPMSIAAKFLGRFMGALLQFLAGFVGFVLQFLLGFAQLALGLVFVLPRTPATKPKQDCG